MNVMSAYSSVIDATELPRIIHLKDNLYGAAFSLMKLLPARYMIDRAEAQGLLRPGCRVIETSSGTFGLGLALVCRLRGYPLTIVGDAAIDRDLRTRLTMLGADVEVVKDNGHPQGIQGARLDRLAELRRIYPSHYIPGQYDSPDNPAAYALVDELLAQAMGPVDHLVGPVGSGGSTGGLADAIRRRTPHLRLVGVDTHGSVIFGMPDQLRVLRGLGNSLHPANVRHTAYDEIHWVNASEAFRATRDLFRRFGLFMGPTSGAAYLAAAWTARMRPDQRVLMLLPDEGYRYQSTVYNEDWLRDNSVWLDSIPPAPTRVAHPGEAGATWAYINWNRRELAEVMTEPQREDLAFGREQHHRDGQRVRATGT